MSSRTDKTMNDEYSKYAEALAAKLNFTPMNVDASLELMLLKPVTLQDFYSLVSLVMPLAEVAGVSFDEIQKFCEFLVFEWGYQFAELPALLRGSIMSLVKPSERMKMALAEIGFPSGYEAILAHGLNGTILMLNSASALFQSDIAATVQNYYALHVVKVVIAREDGV